MITPHEDLPAWARYGYFFPALFLFVLPITHTVAIRTICLALSLVLAIYVWLKDRPPAPPRYLLVAIGLWAGIAILSLTWSVELDYSEGEVRNEIGYTLVAFFVFYALTRGETELRLWLRALVASAFAIGAYSIYNYVAHDDWVTKGYVGDRQAYSTWVTLVFPALLLGLFWPSRPVPRLAAGAALVMVLATGALTLNRMMAISVLASAFVFFLPVVVHAARQPGRRGLAIGGFVAAIVVLTIPVVLAWQWKAEFIGRGGQGIVAQIKQDGRLQIWPIAIERIEAQPLTGYGYGRGIQRREYRAAFPDNPYHWHGHNMFLNVAVGTGLPGLAALILVFGALAWRGVALAAPDDARRRMLGGMVLAVLTAAIVKNLTDDTLVRDASLLFWSLVGIAVGLGGRLGLENRPA